MESRYLVEAGFMDFLRSAGEGLKSFGLSLLPYLARMVTMNSNEIIQVTNKLMNKEEIDPEFKKQLINKVSGMAVGDAVQYLTQVATQSQRGSQYVYQQEQGLPRRKTRRASLKCAVLSAEELDSYYTGEELPLYCSNCKNGDYASSGKVGCTIADDPNVREFLDRFQKEEFTSKGEKCPGFSSEEQTDSKETLFPTEASKILFKFSDEVRGDMVKEVPMQPVSELEESDDVDPLSMLQEAIDKLVQDPTSEMAQYYKEVIEGIILDMKKEDSTSIGQDLDYSYLDEVTQGTDVTERTAAQYKPSLPEDYEFPSTVEGVQEFLEYEDTIPDRVLEIYEIGDERW